MGQKFHLTGHESMLLLSAAIIVFIVIFWLIPKFQRNVEKSKTKFYSCRAVVSFGPSYLNKSSVLYRLTLYDDFFVLVFLGCTKINYVNVENLRFRRNGVPKVSMLVHGVSINIYGEFNSINKLYSYLEARSRRYTKS